LIDSRNTRFVIENDFLIDIVDHNLIRNFAGSPDIAIPGDIVIFGLSSFSSSRSVLSISFASDSRPIRIESNAGSYSSLRSIVIRSSVKILGPSCFEWSKELKSLSFESNSRLVRTEATAFACIPMVSILIPHSVRYLNGSAFLGTPVVSSLIKTESGRFAIEIPAHIAILSPSCFSGFLGLKTISFASPSRLTRIGSDAFSDSGLQSIVSPKTIQFLDGSALASSLILFCQIENGNERFVMETAFLIDPIDHKLIPTFSISSHVDIPGHIAILGRPSFAYYTFILSISFELP
jgi:hypothetical protein